MSTLPLHLTVIERTIERAGKFLRTLGRHPEIMRMMQDLGYTREDHEEGWRWYLLAMGHDSDTVAVLDQEVKADSSNPKVAHEALQRWVERNYPRAEAVLRRLFPEQQQYLCAGFDGAVQHSGIHLAVVDTFLQRVEHLRDGTDPERETTRLMDRKAIDMLERRNILSPALEAQLRDWIQEAKELPVDNVISVDVSEMDRGLALLKDWLDDWARMIRQEIPRRDVHIQLGLSKRRNKKTEEAVALT